MKPHPRQIFRIFSIWLILGLLISPLRPAQANPTSQPPSDQPSPNAPIPQSPDPQSKIEPLLLKQLAEASETDFFVWMVEKADLASAASLLTKEAKGQFVFETLRETAERTQKDLRALLDAQGISYRPYYIANKILIRSGGESLLLALASRPDVEKITANHKYQLEEPKVHPEDKRPQTPETVEGNIAFVNADDAWALGITGQGTVLAANDTGLSWNHPALINQYRGWDGATANHNYNWWDATGTYPTAPGDGHGHGTHVSGTMVGDDGGTNQIGMAPGAKIVHCKNLDDFGGGDDATITECFEWDLAPWDLNGQNPDPAMAPDAINNSWGYWGGGYPIFDDEIAALQAAGILVEVSAGNEGPSCQTLRSPGDYSEVMTTGSVSWMSGNLPGTLSWFSSRGPSVLSPDYLPDIMAPGENVRSSLPGGGYQAWDGTSMAGPHVTGLIGLLWEANPGLRGLIPETNQIIQMTAIPLTGQSGSNCGGDYTTGPNHDWGYGTIDALAAVQAALAFGNPGILAGTVTDSATSDPLPGVLIEAALTPNLIWKATTGANGQYSRVVFSGTYTVTASLYGYFPETVAGVQVIEDQTTTLNFQLDPTPFYLVSGEVTDANTGWPLYARIDIQGYPYGPVWTDPQTGVYSVSLAAGIPYTFRVSPWVAGYQTAIRNVGPLAGPQTEDFAVLPDLVACVAPGYLPDFVYFEDFEQNDGGYTVEGGFSSWAWGVPTSGPRSAHSGQNVWATNLSGNYFDNDFGMLTSPNIDMSAYAGETVILTWWQWLQTESSFDYAWVDVSNNGGSTWTTIYGPIDGSVDTTWTKKTMFLDPSYAVSNFRVRFVLQTDFSVTFPGFYVDDIGVGVAAPPPNLYAENFEANNGGYTVSGMTSWDWGTPTRGPSGAYSGINAWGTALDDNYGNNEDGYLTSPVIDLTGNAGEAMLLSWQQWLQTESGYDFASVEVTADGIDWTQVYTASGIITTDWVKWYVELVSGYATPDFQVRFRLQSDNTVTYPGFYVDNVSVDIFVPGPPTVPCNPQTGGLVVGYVTDANSGDPLNGATITSSAGSATSRPTPVDLAVEDGFYIVFAFPGTQPVTATLGGGYGPDVQTPSVPLSGAVWQDFSLPAGVLAANPDLLSVTLDMGQITTAAFELNNNGSLDADFQLREKGGEFIPAALAAAEVPGFQRDSVAVSYATSHQITPAATQPFIYQPPATARFASSSASVLLVAAGDAFQIQAMLQSYPDLEVVDIFDARIGTPALEDLQAYDAVVVISNNGFADPVTMGNVLADYVDAGGTVVQTVPTFYDPSGAGWGLQGRFMDEGYSPFIGTGDWFSYAELGDFDASHPIMEGVIYASDSLRQVMELAPEAELVASWTDDEFVATQDNVVALNTFLADGYAWDGDIPLIVHNSIIYLQSAGDVPWLSTAPITGTVTAQGSTTITVTFDASVPEVNQPGEYQAEVHIKDNTPYTANPVTVSMQVNAPADWGRLSGAITGLGYCDTDSIPLHKASVDIQGIAVTQADTAGQYVYWMPAGSYQVTVSASGYVSQTFSVNVTAGGNTEQNAALRLDAPCSSAAPSSLNLSVAEGHSTTAVLTLDNIGAGPVSFNLLESLLDLQPVSMAAVLPGAAGTSLSGTNSGPASALSLADQARTGEQPEAPLAGWFGALDHPDGIIRYAFAQCFEQPDSYYVFGGVNGSFNLSKTAWRYDAGNNTWTQLADMPAGSETPAAACYQGHIYVMGGNGTPDHYVYNIAANTWSLGAPLPRGVEGAAAAAWDGKVYLVGGDIDFFPGNGVSDEVNIYDIATDTWLANGAPMPVAAGNAGYAQLGPYLYVVGGWGVNAPFSNLTSTQRYDLVNDQWETGPAFTSARADFALAATDGALYAIGGDKDGGGFFEAVKTAERLDLAAWSGGAWAPETALPVALQANNAGFCTDGLFDLATPEIWSVGGLDTNWFLITGRTLFQERAGESCYSIYTDVDWLSFGTPAGSVPGDTTGSLEVIVDASNLGIGQYTATIAIVTNDPGNPLVFVPVTVTVGVSSFQIYLPMIHR